jgi:hypothetical protein
MGFLCTRLTGQNQLVFPGQFGQTLLDNLVNTYKPVLSLPQAQARDTLFGIIDNHNDSLTCVYTGYTIWLDPTKDPTQAAFMNNSPDAINTEHTFPQSLGASELAEGDLHHLYPTRADVNAARANSPFAEISDNVTEEWFYLDQKKTGIPSANRDLYSEKKGDLFEPREDHKGNVARSMFYFYTMYKEQADLANSSFFATQRQTLCAWHYLDPVDQAEWERTWHIAIYQDDKPNPYVLDCTLPERTFCGDLAETCFVSAQDKKVTPEDFRIENVSPNPAREGILFTYSTFNSCKLTLESFTSTGEKTGTTDLGWQLPGEHRFLWFKNNHTMTGLVFFRFTIETGNRRGISLVKAVILP